MKIRRLNEKVEPETIWYYEIREMHQGVTNFNDEGFFYVDPWEVGSHFDDFDWDDVDVYSDPENSRKNLELYVKFMVYLKSTRPNIEYFLVKVTNEKISDERIDMMVTSNKYNI